MTGTGATITDCGGSSAPLHFSSLSVNPNPPKFGTQLTAEGTGTITSAVTSGTYNIAVKLDGFQIFTHSGDICGASSFPLPLGSGSADIQGLTCPTASGQSEKVSAALLLPAGTPSGSYSVEFTGADSSGSQVYCVNLAWTA